MLQNFFQSVFRNRVVAGTWVAGGNKRSRKNSLNHDPDTSNIVVFRYEITLAMAYGSKMKFRTAAVGESSDGVATNRLRIFDGGRCISLYFATVLFGTPVESPIAKSRNAQLDKGGKSFVEQIDGRRLEAYVSGNSVRVGGWWWGVGGLLIHGQGRWVGPKKWDFLVTGICVDWGSGLKVNSNFPRAFSPH